MITTSEEREDVFWIGRITAYSLKGFRRKSLQYVNICTEYINKTSMFYSVTEY